MILLRKNIINKIIDEINFHDIIKNVDFDIVYDVAHNQNIPINTNNFIRYKNKDDNIMKFRNIYELEVKFTNGYNISYMYKTDFTKRKAIQELTSSYNQLDNSIKDIALVVEHIKDMEKYLMLGKERKLIINPANDKIQIQQELLNLISERYQVRFNIDMTKHYNIRSDNTVALPFNKMIMYYDTWSIPTSKIIIDMSGEKDKIFLVPSSNCLDTLNFKQLNCEELINGIEVDRDTNKPLYLINKDNSEYKFVKDLFSEEDFEDKIYNPLSHLDYKDIWEYYKYKE